jgi:hypothetical protein
MIIFFIEIISIKLNIFLILLVIPLTTRNLENIDGIFCRRIIKILLALKNVNKINNEILLSKNISSNFLFDQQFHQHLFS